MWRHWLDDLTDGHTLVRYDERGCGLSDRQDSDQSVDAWVADLEAVVDAAGLDRFALLGISRAAAVAIVYAVRHPERVTQLVLYGGSPRGRKRRGPEARREEDELLSVVRARWAEPNPAFRRLFSMLFLPAGTDEQMDWFDELQRRTTTTENARASAARASTSTSSRTRRGWPSRRSSRTRGATGSCQSTRPASSGR